MDRKDSEKEYSVQKEDEKVEVLRQVATDEITGKDGDDLSTETGSELDGKQTEEINSESVKSDKKKKKVKSPRAMKGVPQNTNKEGTGSPKADKADRQQSSFTKNPKLAIIPLFIAFFVIVVAILLHSPVPPPPDFDFPKIFEDKIIQLPSSFTNQTDRFWRILKNRGMAHLRNASPPQPLVFLLAAPPAAHGTVDCLARKLAAALDPRHKRMLAMIDGREERSYPGEMAKKKMDDFLITRFKEGHRAALVHHLELLPPPSPLLFYSYCDDQNAPHKHVAIIFTVHLPVEPDASLDPIEAEGSVEKYLADEVWAKEDKDAVAALLSRVAVTVALMNGEPSSLATC